MDYTKEQLRERFKKLPPDLQEAIFSVDTANILHKIGKDNNLTIIKTGILADETGLLMLGITKPNEFISNLTKRLDIEKEAVRKISKEINEQVFFKVRESLRRMHGEKTEDKPTPVDNTVDEVEPLRHVPRTIKPHHPFANAKAQIKPVKPVSESPQEETPPAKDIFEEKTKEGIHRSTPSVTSVEESATETKEKEPPKTKKPGYPGGVDPYREPLN